MNLLTSYGNSWWMADKKRAHVSSLHLWTMTHRDDLSGTCPKWQPQMTRTFGGTQYQSLNRYTSTHFKTQTGSKLTISYNILQYNITQLLLDANPPKQMFSTKSNNHDFLKDKMSICLFHPPIHPLPSPPSPPPFNAMHMKGPWTIFTPQVPLPVTHRNHGGKHGMERWGSKGRIHNGWPKVVNSPGWRSANQSHWAKSSVGSSFGVISHNL